MYTINGVCEEKDTVGKWSDHKVSDDQCSAQSTYTGKSGCVFVNGLALYHSIEPFMGFVFVVIGGLMTFAGAKFLFQLVSAVVTLIVSTFFYFFISNLFFGLTTGTGLKVGLLIAALALGLGAAFVSFKLTVKFAVPIVAGAGGAFGFKLLSKLVGINNEYAVIAILIIGAVAGVFIGYKLNNFVRTFGTAFLGSYILIRGFGFFFGGFPDGANDVNVHKIKGDDKIVFYFIGFVVAFIAGSVVQYKLFHDENHDHEKEQEDMFKGEDEDKKCGCF